MSGVDYSTDNANYRQIYAVHTTPIMPVRDPIFRDENFGEVDGVVLEACQSKEWFDLLWESEFKSHYDDIFDAIHNTGKPMYFVDVLTTSGGRGVEAFSYPVLDILGLMGVYDGADKIEKQVKEKKEMSRRGFLKFWGAQVAKIAIGGYLGTDLICRNYPVQTGENPESLARLNSSRMHLVPTPQFELRNAISARKIEEFIVPELREQAGRKPNIVLVYGAGHSGLKEDLQYQRLRNFYINLYDALGFPGIDTTYIDTVTNLSINSEGQFDLQHRESNLFKPPIQ